MEVKRKLEPEFKEKDKVTELASVVEWVREHRPVRKDGRFMPQSPVAPVKTSRDGAKSWSVQQEKDKKEVPLETVIITEQNWNAHIRCKHLKRDQQRALMWAKMKRTSIKHG